MHPLSGVRVIELGVAVAGPLAGRYLAHLGAEVIKVESRERSAQTALTGPGWAPANLGLAARDLLISNNNFNAQKLGLGLELKTPGGRSILDRLIARSDVFLTNFSLPAIRSLGIEYEQVRAHNPRIVYMSMPGYGSGEGPYSEFRSWGPNLSSVAGLDHLTGDPDRPPVMTPSPLPDFVCSFHGVLAVQAALRHRELSGQGQHIDLSQFDVMVACLGPSLGLMAAGGPEAQRAGNRREGVAPRGVFPTRGEDRWVAITVQNDEQWRSLGRVAGQPAWARDPEHATLEGRVANQDRLEAELSAWTQGQTADAVAYHLQAAGVPAAPVQDAWDHVSDPQLRSRRFWRVVRHPFLDRDLVSGFPAQFSETAARIDRAAPALGEANHEVLGRVLELAPDAVARLEADGALPPVAQLPGEVASGAPLRRPFWPWAGPLLGLDEPVPAAQPADTSPPTGDSSTGRPGPGGALSGVRVVDLSGELAAYGTRLLADLGADVVRVEPPEGAAIRDAPPLYQGESFTQLYLDAGKRSVVLDLAAEDGRRAMARLLAGADLLYEGGPPGALAASGFGRERLRELNPQLSLVQVTAFGQEGPFRDWRADELILWAMSGMLRLTGYPDRRPLVPGAQIAHYFIGAFAAAAAAAALHARDRIGRGQQVDISAYEVLVICGGQELPAQLETLTPLRQRAGSRALSIAPYSYYQCRDRMVCLLALMADHWTALAQWVRDETGIEEVLAEHLASSAQIRSELNDEIEGYINALTGRYDADEFCLEAQRRGIPAAPVNPIGATLADAHLDAQGYWSTVEHDALGAVRWPGPPYRLSGSPAARQRRAPALGEHTEGVLREWGARPTRG